MVEAGASLDPRLDVVELLRPLAQRAVGTSVLLGQHRVLNVDLIAPDLEIVPEGLQELLLSALAVVIGWGWGVIAFVTRPPDRIEQIRGLVIDRRGEECQAVVDAAFEHGVGAAYSTRHAIDLHRHVIGVLGRRQWPPRYRA